MSMTTKFKPKGLDLIDHDGTGYLELQRDDEAGVYEDDDEAWGAFIGQLEDMQGRARTGREKAAVEMAISLLNNWREPMASVMRGEPV